MSTSTRKGGTTHTPGPWLVKYPEGRGRHGFSKFRVVAPHGMTATIIVNDVGGDSDAEAAANANLIAVLPEMYEALRALVCAITDIDQDGDRDLSPVLPAAFRVLAKVEGAKS